MIYSSKPGNVTYDEEKHQRTLVIIELKNLQILKGDEIVDFTESRMISL